MISIVLHLTRRLCQLVFICLSSKITESYVWILITFLEKMLAMGQRTDNYILVMLWIPEGV